MSVVTYEELCKKRREDIKARNDATNHRPNHYKKWTSEEEVLVSDSSLSIEEKAEILGRSIYAVGARMTMLGVRNNNDTPWTDDEIALAANASISNKDLAKKLNRSIHSVISKRFVLKTQGHDDLLCDRYHNYTDTEDDIILTHTVAESSDIIGISIDAVKSRRSKLRRNGRMTLVDNHFSDDDLKIVADTSISNQECARLLHRSAKSISDKRYDLRRKGLLNTNV